MAILTKDNMLKRKWQGDPSCNFCDQEETADHLSLVVL
uniref:Reverse transcriptase zinc-binding domain-containing protein n=1 Tax=Setaria italica TaxID=4555 RepID=K3XUC1_SETIT